MKAPSRRKASPSLDSYELARVVAEAALAMKAEEVVIVRVGEQVNYTDYFVIASGRSTRQAQAIAENIQRAIHARRSRPIGVEGERDGNWILIDWGSVIAHVFHHPVRKFYDIEHLWGAGEMVEAPEGKK